MFRGAVRADLPRILDIYARAREFMAKNGNPTQWGDNYPSPELLEEDIDTNRLFVYMINGRMQAVFAFILGEDPTYKVIEDGQWLNDTLPYGTLHRLASAEESKGVGKAVVEWCLEHCESLRAACFTIPVAEAYCSRQPDFPHPQIISFGSATLMCPISPPAP